VQVKLQCPEVLSLVRGSDQRRWKSQVPSTSLESSEAFCFPENLDSKQHRRNDPGEDNFKTEIMILHRFEFWMQ